MSIRPLQEIFCESCYDAYWRARYERIRAQRSAEWWADVRLRQAVGLRRRRGRI